LDAITYPIALGTCPTWASRCVLDLVGREHGVRPDEPGGKEIAPPRVLVWVSLRSRHKQGDAEQPVMLMNKVP